MGVNDRLLPVLQSYTHPNLLSKVLLFAYLLLIGFFGKLSTMATLETLELVTDTNTKSSTNVTKWATFAA